MNENRAKFKAVTFNCVLVLLMKKLIWFIIQFRQNLIILKLIGMFCTHFVVNQLLKWNCFTQYDSKQRILRINKFEMFIEMK